jgi:hypothetical protein
MPGSGPGMTENFIPFTPLRERPQNRVGAATSGALVYERRLLLEPGDLVLHVQFLSLQFRNFEAVDRRVCQRFGDFRFKGVVPSFELRKMRFDRHVACLLALMDAASPDQTPSLDYDSP